MKIAKIFQDSHLKDNKTINKLILVFISALVVVGGISLTSKVQAAVDETALKKVILAAFTAPSSLVVIANQPEDLGVALNRSSIDKSRGQAKDTLTNIYDSNCITCQNIKEGIDQSIKAQEKGQFRALGAGIHDIDWRQIVVNGDSASVTLAATLWSKVKFKDQSNKQRVVTPTAGFVEIFTLNRVNGKWIITNQVQDDISASQLSVNKNRSSDNDNTPPAGEQQPPKGPQITPYKTK